MPYIVSWTRPKLLLVISSVGEERRIEGIRDKIQFKAGKKNHAR